MTDALNQVTSYGYDEVGNRITQTDANNHTTNYQYDQRGRRTGRTLPLGQSESYTYDANGNLSTKTDFNGKTTTYAYDGMNQLLSKTPDPSFGAPPVTFTYIRGQRFGMTDASGSTGYFYSSGRVTQLFEPAGQLNYSYDLADNVTGINAAGLNVWSAPRIRRGDHTKFACTESVLCGAASGGVARSAEPTDAASCRA